MVAVDNVDSFTLQINWPWLILKTIIHKDQYIIMYSKLILYLITPVTLGL